MPEKLPLTFYRLFVLIKIKLRKPLRSVEVAETHHLVFLKNICFCSSVLAADTAVDARIFIVKHVDVEVSHKAGWTSVI